MQTDIQKLIESIAGVWVKASEKPNSIGTYTCQIEAMNKGELVIIHRVAFWDSIQKKWFHSDLGKVIKWLDDSEEIKALLLSLLQQKEAEAKSDEEAATSAMIEEDWLNFPKDLFYAGCRHRLAVDYKLIMDLQDEKRKHSTQVESLTKELEEARAKEKADLRMLREYSMRLGIALPENEEDMDWSDKGMQGKKTGYLILWLFEKLGLGKEDEQIMPGKLPEKYQRTPMGDILKEIEKYKSEDRLNNRKTREG